MNLYLVECVDVFEYDTVRSAVIWAESPNVAKKMFSEIRAAATGKLRARKVRLDGPRKVVHTYFAAG